MCQLKIKRKSPYQYLMFIIKQHHIHVTLCIQHIKYNMQGDSIMASTDAAINRTATVMLLSSTRKFSYSFLI